MWRRLVRLSLQALLALAVVEVGLQIAALVVQRTTRDEMSAGWQSGDLRVLCLGDSNTYGVLVERNETWPAQLQTIWNEEVGSPSFDVLNLGFPGTNSSRLVRDLPRLLETLRPDLTIIMIGVNDFWTLPVPQETEESEEPFWKRKSKLYRFYYLVRKGLEQDGIDSGEGIARVGDQEFEMGWKAGRPERRPPSLEPELGTTRTVELPDGRTLRFRARSAAGKLAGDQSPTRHNLEALVEQASAGETRLFLMTYPSRFQNFYKAANAKILAVAADTTTPLIDLTRAFEPICPEVPCPSYLLFDDHHPNTQGYTVIARAIVEALRGGLRETTRK